jgi:nitrous oxidase accessory protein NosD
LQASLIEGNHFVNCSTCIHLSNPDHVTITNNEFDTTRGGNAISVVTYNFRFPYGEQLQITGNRGHNLKRMGIEIVGGEPNTRMNGPLISDNTFTDWQEALANDPFGISVAVGVNPRILRNTLSGRQGGYGIEVGAPGAQVTGNVISGFFQGIVIQGQSDVILNGNTVSEPMEAGILFSNAGANLRAQILDNRVVNAHKFGIGMSPNDYAGALIERNTIEREGGRFDADAAGQQFMGIKMDAGSSGPVDVSGNRVVQTASAPPVQFDFIGIGFFGGVPSSTYQDNIIESKSAIPLGTGFLFWFAPYAEDSTVAGNQFINLRKLTNGFTSGRVHSWGNRAIGVQQGDPNIVRLPPGSKH